MNIFVLLRFLIFLHFNVNLPGLCEYSSGNQVDGSPLVAVMKYFQSFPDFSQWVDWLDMKRQARRGNTQQRPHTAQNTPQCRRAVDVGVVLVCWCVGWEGVQGCVGGVGGFGGCVSCG